MRKKFQLDKSRAVALGVCAGISNYIGIDATIVRIGMVVATLVGGFPWTLIAYGLAAWFFQRSSGSKLDSRVPPSASAVSDAWAAAAESTRRASEVDRVVAGENAALAREIEALRRS